MSLLMKQEGNKEANKEGNKEVNKEVNKEGNKPRIEEFTKYKKRRKRGFV